MSSRAERELKSILEGRGWVVVRAAGSLGDVDLLAVKFDGLTGDTHVRFIEVKETGRKLKNGSGVVYTSGTRVGDQVANLKHLAQRGYKTLVALRTKGRTSTFPDGLPRWTFHRIHGGTDPTSPIVQSDGDMLEGWF